MPDEEERLYSEIEQAAKAKGLNIRIGYQISVQGPQVIRLKTDDGDGLVEYLPDGRADQATRINILQQMLNRVREL